MLSSSSLCGRLALSAFSNFRAMIMIAPRTAAVQSWGLDRTKRSGQSAAVVAANRVHAEIQFSHKGRFVRPDTRPRARYAQEPQIKCTEEAQRLPDKS